MTREFYSDERKAWVSPDVYYADKAKGASLKRSSLPSPYFITDDLPGGALLNHADNRTYTSKAAYVRAVKAMGCEVVGTERLPPKPPPKRYKLSDDARREIRGRVRAKWDGKKPRV